MEFFGHFGLNKTEQINNIVDNINLSNTSINANSQPQCPYDDQSNPVQDKICSTLGSTPGLKNLLSAI